MGLVLWLVSGLVVFLIARIIPIGRGRRKNQWLSELILALFVTLLLGILATALDFGGWRELDWRAAAFCACGAFAAIGLLRVAMHAR